uniref:Centrosomal protein of 162 kDa n=1 Tax=Macrostomum lignano TaxID=282301 RepID=A0A1I8JAW8_9PLAT
TAVYADKAAHLRDSRRGRSRPDRMQNCYNTDARGGRRPAAEAAAASDIDERLTRRHLETLEFAQEIVRQNRELKAADLCNQRVDEVAKRLAKQHEREVAALLHDRAEAERTWYSARQQEQAELLKLQMALRDRDELAAQLEARVGQQAEALTAEAERATSLEAAVAAAVKERDAARRSLTAAEERRREEEAAQHELSAERQKCAELRLRLDQLARDRDADSQAEAERQRQLEDCQRELEELRQRAERLELRLADSERRLAEARAQESRLAAENGALEAEIEALRLAAKRQQQPAPLAQAPKQQAATARESGDANFREFVAVKREVAALREENERLRGRLRTAGSTGKKTRD